MSLPWFRLYHRMVDDEKLRLLAFEDRWHFVALCCLKADGLLDTELGPLRDRKIAVRLGVQVRELEEIGRRLKDVELIDGNLSPVAWNELQFKSDVDGTAARRQREKRNRDKVLKPVTDVSRVTVTDVTRLDTDTDTDTDTKRKNPLYPPQAGEDWFPKNEWDDYAKMRRSIRKPMTDAAIKIAGAKLSELRDAGNDPRKVLQQSVMNSWQGLFEVKGGGNGKMQMSLA